MTDAPEKIWAHPRASEPLIEYTRSDIAQARIAELEAELAAKTLAELPAHMGMNDYDAQSRIAELEEYIESLEQTIKNMTAHIRIDPDE